MISPYLKLMRGKFAGLRLCQTLDHYQSWLTERCKHNAHRVKACDISIGGKRLSQLKPEELESLTHDQTLTTWELDLVKAFL